MKLNPQIIITLCIVYSLQLTLSRESHDCERTCNSASLKDLPSPFGFSDGCQIRLNCTAAGVMIRDEFPVQSISNQSMLISIPSNCERPIETLSYLFTENYSPTVHNGILLRNCSTQIGECFIPYVNLQTQIQPQDCGSGNETVNCYREANNQSMFIDYSNLIRTGCTSFFSTIATAAVNHNSSVSLEFQVVRLEWWLRGNCSDCSDHARCIPVDSQYGYRCDCSQGFVGDGYRTGFGCRKESSCNPTRYLSGHCGGTTRVGVLIGGVAAGAVLMVAVALLCCFIRKRRILNCKNKMNRRLCEATGITIPIYSYKQIEKATNCFCHKRLLGTGAYGAVYSGKLHNEEWVAIKRIKHRSGTDSIEQVMNEIKLLSSVSHPNLVKLLGCSVENDEQILVYEYMPNGTLCQHLQKEQGNGLPWPVRLTIVTETSQAIAHLHSAINPPIYHRDIKSSNILLDYNFKTKVADFGLSRLGLVESSHVSTAPQGTPGYLDPQYHQNFHLSDKSDVYSFGVVLVEIITALKAVDFSRRQNEVILASLAVDRISKGRLDTIIDPFIKQNEDKWTFTSIQKVAELAFRCLAYHSETRPSIVEVAAELEQIRLGTCAPSSEESLSYASGAPFSSSSSFNVKPIIEIRPDELDTSKLFGSTNSIDSDMKFSPVSAQDSWLSEQSSPSSNSLLGK